MHRTQILLEDEQYERLRLRARRSGKAIGELVRRAVDEVYGAVPVADRIQALEDSHGAAGPGDFDGLDGEAYVSRARRGLDERLRIVDAG